MYYDFVLSGIYKDDASIIIDGNLDAIDFSSGVTDAEWNITITIKSSNGMSMTMSDNFMFGSSFDGGSACYNTANAFNPAVQALLSKVVKHPDFYRFVSAN